MPPRHADQAPAVPPGEPSVFVQAPARLHFGMLDLAGTLGRRFGGIGTGVSTPSLLVEVGRAPTGVLEADGPSAERATEFARRMLHHHGLTAGVRIRVHRAIAAHSGLGSGTQLALAVARGIAELEGLPTEAAALARAVHRARRSAVGTWLFAGGGFILEGGRRDEGQAPAPCLARIPMPEAWRCVLAIPRGTPGISGSAESTAFSHLPAPPAGDAARVAHLVLMALLPALVEGDVRGFGAALSEIQCINGRWFAPEQGGAFAPGRGAVLLDRLRDAGAAGVGQSSWGPAVYGIAGSAAEAAPLAEVARDVLGDNGTVSVTAFAAAGARVWRAAPAASER